MTLDAGHGPAEPIWRGFLSMREMENADLSAHPRMPFSEMPIWRGRLNKFHFQRS
jgi:hypothetical protein